MIEKYAQVIDYVENTLVCFCLTRNLVIMTYVVRDVEYEANYLLKTDWIDPEVYEIMVYNLYASVVHLQGFRLFEMPHRWDIIEE